MSSSQASSKALVLQALVQRLGGGFAKALGIRLEKGDESQLFRWFLAAFLYGARISETIASRTYQEFEGEGVLTPEAVQKTGWDGLVRMTIMRYLRPGRRIASIMAPSRLRYRYFRYSRSSP
jgi:hypothetical protein